MLLFEMHNRLVSAVQISSQCACLLSIKIVEHILPKIDEINFHETYYQRQSRIEFNFVRLASLILQF